ncbi:Uncharacterized protein OBRU01_14872 [Operophtera brumata]|uniref:Uncharacterized protein n=1 Tax=Operophtera brumata TaxID=104452 RepID=A0A0L7L6H4_OPEBR|nr:Uncharacterized protein OBRU01_14872 [Operophtera brumata]
MDPLSILQNRIEQLEAKLGVSNSRSDGQQGDSATTSLLNTAQAINNATAGHEKLTEAMQMANELNNYTDPNFVEKLQETDMHMREVAAAEPVEPVLASEAIQQAPQMQAQVTQGIQELAETCGAAASDASQQLADVAQKVEKVEEKMFPKRRNGLD